jgi:hypothetical protein
MSAMALSAPPGVQSRACVWMIMAGRRALDFGADTARSDVPLVASVYGEASPCLQRDAVQTLREVDM